MEQPAYYRDLIDRILTETDDDIPVPPSRDSLVMDKFKRSLNRPGLNFKVWQDFLGAQRQFGSTYLMPMQPFDYNLNVLFSVENNSLTVLPDMEITFEYPRLPGFGDNFDSARVTAWHVSIEDKIDQQLSQQVYEIYGIKISDFSATMWAGNAELIVTSRDFVDWVESQLQGIERVLTKDNLAAVKAVVSQQLTGKTT